MADESAPLLLNSSSPSHGFKVYQNPVTGSAEQLAQINDYMPITESDADLESLIGDINALHQHDRNCNIQMWNKARRKRIKHIIIAVSLLAYLSVFALELFEIIEIPFGFVMALLLFLGGIVGYKVKSSLPSLIAGITFSLLFLIAGILNWNKNPWGFKLALTTSILLFLTGFKRSFSTRFQSPVPIVLLFLGLMSCGYYVFRYYS